MTIEAINNIKNATISLVISGKTHRSVVPDSTFQSLLLARNLDNLDESSHILIRNTFLDLMDTKLRLFNITQVDSFRFTYTDEDGYKHIIER